MKLLLVDGLSVVRRIYEACPGPDSPNRVADAVKSTVASLRRALNEHSPTHALAIFDFGGTTWRHQLYPAYRANRQPMPTTLRDALPLFRQQIEDLGIHTIAVPEVEAEDVVATVFYRWHASGRGPTVILSADKDVAVLAADGALVRDHFKGAWHDDEWCRGRFGVDTAQLPDLLALTGDKIDDIPGVPGVGAKTAAKWLLQYGDLPAVIAHSADIPGKIGIALRDHLEQLVLARELVTLKTDVACGITWNAIKIDAESEGTFSQH